MKKFIFSMVLAFMTIFSANAQLATENATLVDNMFVTVNGGVSTPLAFDAVFPVNPSAGIAIGKWFSPVWGAEIEGTAWFGSHSYGGSTARFDGDMHNAIRGTYVGVNGLLNLSNLLGGYNGTPRKFEVNALAGIGWVHGFRPHMSDKYNNDLGAKTGLDFAFNLGKNRAHTVSFRPAVLWDLSAPGTSVGSLAFNKLGAQLYLGLAYTYHFKTSNGTHHFKLYDVGAMQNEIEYLNRELQKKPTEVIREVRTEVPTTVNVTDTYVFFAYDSAELDDRAKTELDKLGENGVYRVDAWASSEGSTEYNLNLSQRRADVVKAYLENRGCRVEVAEGHGVQFGTTTGRVAVVTIK